jgi:hypothetical protein
MQQHPPPAQAFQQQPLPQPLTTSVFEAAAGRQQQQQPGVLSFQQRTVHVVPAPGPRHTVVTAARPPGVQQYAPYPQQAQQYSTHMPAVPSISAVATTTSAAHSKLEGGPGLPTHLLQHTASLAAAPAVSAKDAAAAARAARQVRGTFIGC